MTRSRPEPGVVVRLAGGGDLLAVLGAAYALTDRAWVSVRGGRAPSVTLWPKPGSPRAPGGGLERAFRLAYEDQKIRWEVLRRGRDLAAQTLQRRLALADAAKDGGGRPQAGLAPQRQAEIAGLLEEASREAWDPLGIATPWSQRRSAGAR